MEVPHAKTTNDEPAERYTVSIKLSNELALIASRLHELRQRRRFALLVLSLCLASVLFSIAGDVGAASATCAVALLLWLAGKRWFNEPKGWIDEALGKVGEAFDKQ